MEEFVDLGAVSPKRMRESIGLLTGFRAKRFYDPSYE
jgi:hypothetical protein